MANESVHRSEIPAWDCYQLLDEHRTGRLGIIEHGYPIAIPVSYRLAGTPSERRIVCPHRFEHDHRPVRGAFLARDRSDRRR